ncbi:MAG TPA: tetratricopeptide repeat protein, partial [Thermoplasmata archaeon]|nr:tetratricopeptide repeat protein [Thermoplasmata archaeon]
LAGDPEAGPLAEEADVLNSLGNWAEAGRRYDIAAEAQGSSPVEAGLIQCRRAYCRMRVGKFVEASKILQSLESNASALVRVTAEVVAVEQAAREGRLEECVELGNRAETSVKDLGPAAPPILVADLHNAIGSALGLLRRGEEAEPHFRTAMAAAKLGGLPVRTATIAANCAVYLVEQGRLDEAIELLEGREPDLRRHGDTVMLATLLNNLAALHILGGDMDGGRGWLEEALRIYSLLGDSANAAAVRYNLGIHESIRDRAPGAARQFEEALRLLSGCEGKLPEPAATVACLVRIGLAEARNMQGKRSLAAPLLDEVAKCEECRSKAVVQARLMIARSRAAQQSRKYDGSVELARRAVALASGRGEEGALAACRLSLALAAAGRDAESAHEAREAEKLSAGFPVHAAGFRKAYARAFDENRKRRDATAVKSRGSAGGNGGGVAHQTGHRQRSPDPRRAAGREPRRAREQRRAGRR